MPPKSTPVAALRPESVTTGPAWTFQRRGGRLNTTVAPSLEDSTITTWSSAINRLVECGYSDRRSREESPPISRRALPYGTRGAETGPISACRRRAWQHDLRNPSAPGPRPGAARPLRPMTPALHFFQTPSKVMGTLAPSPLLRLLRVERWRRFMTQIGREIKNWEKTIYMAALLSPFFSTSPPFNAKTGRTGSSGARRFKPLLLPPALA